MQAKVESLDASSLRFFDNNGNICLIVIDMGDLNVEEML